MNFLKSKIVGAMGNIPSSLTYHDLLGDGNSGKVYRATWISKEGKHIESAAKKIGFDEKSVEKDFWDKVRHEIEYLKKLDHVNIIRYYDTILVPHHVIIVTEYASKGSLFDFLKDKDRLASQLAKKWALHLIRGIEFIQQNKIVHRDIKSPNCVISEGDILKICDFGIAKELTKTMTTVSSRGTVKWLAPEVFTEEKLSSKADIYAFGIVLWELHSCEEPYNGMRPETVMYNVGRYDMRPEIPADCLPAMKTLMENCWHVEREQRPTIDQIIEQLGD